MSKLPPPDADAPTVEGFLKTVLKSGLLDRAQLQDALRDVPKEQRDDPHALAEHLVRKGKLSRFQAGKILRGTGKGLLLGHFQVLSPIGRGGMSTVYLARDERSGELVALKLLPPSRWRNEERLLARFQREMELSRRVAHPHLAWTYESGICQRVYYLAMEYIPGKNLARVVAGGGPLSVPRAARLMAEAASGLEHAHNQGLIHRDLKPSNIMVTPNDHAKVLDLGLALMQGEKAEERVIGGQGYIVGTMDYIAPEQTTDSAAVDGRADIYSLGCTLYFALTGQPPFPGGTSRDKVMRHRGEEPTPLLRLAPCVPPGFARLIQQMMAKNPAERPSSAVAVEEELRAWATDDTMLPLDCREDAYYEQSIAVLQEAEPSAEYNLPSISAPEVDLSAEIDLATVQPPRWSIQTKLLLLAIALVLGGMVLLTALILLGIWLGGT
ncbi:MAG TPA: serine/threonine-protein kinase [Gemmataceae bacterium]|nr:serine/threonine-protein kinase [Gemmataceae bacterium]